VQSRLITNRSICFLTDNYRPSRTLTGGVRMSVFIPRVIFKADLGIHLKLPAASSIMLYSERNISATAFII
jgi:hypothetical protein